MHFNVTAHPSAAWTLQQLREAIDDEAGHRYLLHDRDSIFASGLDQSIRHLGLRVLKSPPHTPKANAICERLIGTIRRECLDWLRGGREFLNTGESGRTAPITVAGTDPRGAGNDEEAYAAHS
jgi:transposase InsO family protein